MKKMKAVLSLLLLCTMFLSIVSCDLNIPNLGNTKPDDLKGSDAQFMPTVSKEPIDISQIPIVTNFTAYSAEPTNANNGLKFVNSLNLDNKFHLFYFELGTVYNCPIYSTDHIYFGNENRNLTYSIKHLTQDQLTNSISKATETVNMQSLGLAVSVESSVKVGIEAGVSVSTEFSVNQSLNWTKSWGTTTSISESSAKMYMEELETVYSENFDISVANGYEPGYYYRLSLFEPVIVYGVLIYDVEKDEYSATYQEMLRGDNRINIIEKSKDAVFAYENDGKKLTFDVDRAIKYAKNYDFDNPPPPVATQYALALIRQYCELDNGYVPSTSYTTNDQVKSHLNWELLELIIDGCTYDEDDEKYMIVPTESLELSVKVLHNTGSLPIKAAIGANWYGNALSYDGAGNVFETNISGKSVGHGAYYVKVTYTDGTSDEFNATDFLKNAKQDEMIKLSVNLKPNKKVMSVDVVFVYELVFKFYNGWWYTKYSNWRCTQTLNFK